MLVKVVVGVFATMALGPDCTPEEQRQGFVGFVPPATWLAGAKTTPSTWLRGSYSPLCFLGHGSVQLWAGDFAGDWGSAQLARAGTVKALCVLSCLGISIRIFSPLLIQWPPPSPFPLHYNPVRYRRGGAVVSSEATSFPSRLRLHSPVLDLLRPSATLCPF